MIRIFNDDCLNILGDFKNVDMVLVDLPYGQTECKWDSLIDLDKMWDGLKRACKPNAVCVFFCTVKFGNQLINSNPKGFRYDLVWQKNNSVGFFNARKMPMRSHELIYIFKLPVKKNTYPTYNPQKTAGKPYTTKGGRSKYGLYGETARTGVINTGDRHPLSILRFNADANRLHRTQKPVDLCEWLIHAYSNDGDTVLDFTMGSGSTGVACIKAGRKFIGIEKNEGIFKTARNRLIAFELLRV